MLKKCFATQKNKPLISVTSAAWKKIDEIIQKKQAHSFLFSAIPGGCNGFNYNLKLLDETNFKKTFNEYTNGNKIKSTIIENNNSKIFVDPLSEMFLLGTTIDYIDEDYDKGIFENKFIFLPNKELMSTCGCGISFTPK